MENTTSNTTPPPENHKKTCMLGRFSCAARCGKPWLKWVGGVCILAALLVLVFARGNEMIAKPFLESQLSRVAENLKAQAALSGDYAELTYGEITIDGSLFNKKASIAGIRLEYIAQLPFGNTQHTIVSTPVSVVTADQLSAHAINIRFPSPFKLERAGYQPLLLTFDGTPVYQYQSESTREKHSVEFPPKLVMSVDAPQESPVEVTLSYDKGATFEREVNHEAGESSSKLNVKNLKLTSNVENNEIHLTAFDVHSKEMPAAAPATPAATNAAGMPVAATQAPSRQFQSGIAIADLLIKQGEESSGPYTIAADVNGSYTTLTNEEGVTKADTVTMNLSQFSFGTADYAILASGHFNHAPDDPMLYGNANITIQGLDKLRNSDLVGNTNESLKNALVAAITGNADPTATTASFEVKRQKQGTFYIGNTTFENMIGIIVTHALSQPQAPANPAPVVTPADPAPAAAMPLPDASTPAIPGAQTATPPLPTE